jgi:hypothetical protein
MKTKAELLGADPSQTTAGSAANKLRTLPKSDVTMSVPELLFSSAPYVAYRATLVPAPATARPKRVPVPAPVELTRE